MKHNCDDKEFLNTLWEIVSKMQTCLMLQKMYKDKNHTISFDDLFTDTDKNNMEKMFRHLNKVGFTNDCPLWIEPGDWIKNEKH